MKSAKKIEIEETDEYEYNDSFSDTTSSCDIDPDEEDFDLSSDEEHPLDIFDGIVTEASFALDLDELDFDLSSVRSTR